MKTGTSVEIYLKNSTLKLSGIILTISETEIVLKSSENDKMAMWIPKENVLMVKFQLAEPLTVINNTVDQYPKNTDDMVKNNKLLSALYKKGFQIADLKQAQIQEEKEILSSKLKSFEISQEDSKLGQYGYPKSMKPEQYTTKKTFILPGGNSAKLLNLPRKKS